MPEDADAAFRATYAELYDRHLVPLQFAPYAGYLADRVKAHKPRSVLETAAGTGILTQALGECQDSCRLDFVTILLLSKPRLWRLVCPKVRTPEGCRVCHGAHCGEGPVLAILAMLAR